MIIDYIKRAFYAPNWKLAIREIKRYDSIDNIIDSNSEYNKVISNKDCWYADPFVINEGDAIYIYCECYLTEKQKGVIAAGEYKNGNIDMNIIIEQDYHMSYPCIFKYKSQFYMIPETVNNKTIDLYCAKKFPYEWELSKTLMKNVSFVDSTVVIIEDNVYVIGYRLGWKNKVCIFLLDIKSETIQILEELEDDLGRPAGSILFLNNRMLRPVQMSEKKYGESILFKEIKSIRNYCEIESFHLKGKDISIKGEKKIDRIHTFNRIENLEVIDYSNDSFEFARPGKILMRVLKQYLLN